MSGSSSDHKDGATKRKPPSWMSSKEKGGTSHSKKQDGDGEEAAKRVKGRGDTQSAEAALNFSKLMEGVVFVLSGFVNPERSTLRSQALDMGAEYKPDWTPDCTLLVCAFPYTPKFRQVQSDCGTIVSKEWISECYSQKKLVDIERFFMHAGKPWRRNNNQLGINKGEKSSSHEEPLKKSPKLTVAVHEEPRKQPKKSPEKPTGPIASKGEASSAVTAHFSPSKIKEWAIEDLHKTVSWLDSQEEKPEASEMKAIAVEGIITCLQDAIESLKQNKDIQHVMEQWMFIPRVVKELADFEDGKGKKGSLSKEEISKLAIKCKNVYSREFDKQDTSPVKNEKRKGCSNVEEDSAEDDAGFDSDQTVEMTEEEIEIACKQLNC